MSVVTYDLLRSIIMSAFGRNLCPYFYMVFSLRAKKRFAEGEKSWWFGK